MTTYVADRGNYREPVLGPCRCIACGEPLWWGEGRTRHLGNVVFRFGWREDDGHLHRCPNRPLTVAVQ